jgi:hypothetical protein
MKSFHKTIGLRKESSGVDRERPRKLGRLHQMEETN